MKRNILVFPCGSEIGLDIYSSVCYSTYFHLIGASSVNDHGMFVYDDYVPDLPNVDSPLFIIEMSKLVKERNIDAIYPTMDMVITVLKNHEKELNCKIISSPLETTNICLSKELTYQKLRDDVLTPIIYNPKEIPKDAFPVFTKPVVGYGSRGTKTLYSQEDVDRVVKGSSSNLMILEYLPGEEYTVDCFTNKEGILMYCAARKRNRIKNGISVNTSFVQEQAEFEDLAYIINSKIRFRGAWFFQVKRNKNNDLCLMEIASRLGGSSLLSRAIGVNFALLSLFDAFDYDVDILSNNYSVELDRALDVKYKTNLIFDTVYCDYDDCLILNKKQINIEMVRFLYKCINEKKRIVLLSKHDGDLIQELKEFRIDHLFDEIYHIDKHEDKSNYITSERSVFIDDSFAERTNIKSRFNIPVFSPEMIDVIS